MRKIVLLLSGLLLILGRAAWIDVAQAEKSEPTKAGSEKADFEGWKYPGSKELGSGQGAGGFHAMLTTADGLASLTGPKNGDGFSIASNPSCASTGSVAAV